MLRHPLIGKLGLQRELGQCGPQKNDPLGSLGEACVDLFQGVTLLDTPPIESITHVDRDPRTARLFASKHAWTSLKDPRLFCFLTLMCDV